MQMPRVGIVQGAQIARGRQGGAQLLTIPPLQWVAVVFAEFVLPMPQFADMAGADRNMGVTITPVAGDGVFGDSLADYAHALQRPVEQPLGIGLAEQRLQLALTTAKSEDDLTAVAPPGTPADRKSVE